MRSTCQSPDGDPHVQRGELRQQPEGGDRHRQPLAALEALHLLIARLDDRRVEAERRVVEEDLAVDLADVDAVDLPLGDQPDGGLGIGRELEVAGEVVERAERQDAERHLAVHQHRGHGPDGAVAAAGHHRIGPRLHRRAHGVADLLAGNEPHIGFGSGFLEHLPQALGGDALFPARSPRGDSPAL